MAALNFALPAAVRNTLPVALVGAVFLTLLGCGALADLFLLQRLRSRPGWLRARFDALRSRPWNAFDAALILFLFLALNLGLGAALSVAQRVGLASRERLAAAALILQFAAVPLGCLGVAVTMMRRRGLSWRTAFGMDAADWRRQVRAGMLLYTASIPPVFMAGLAYLSILLLAGYPVDSQDVVKLLADRTQPLWMQVYIAMVAVGVAPLTEELLFRGIVLPGMLKHSGTVSSVVAVSLIFAFLHLHIPTVAPLFALAASFSLAYAATGSLLTAMVMHALFNATSLAALFALRDTLSAGRL